MSIVLFTQNANITAEAQQENIGILIDKSLAIIAKSSGTARNYRTAISYFLIYLEEQWSDSLPPSANEYRPFAVASKDGQRTVWSYKAPSEILTMLSPGVLLGFESWLTQNGVSSSTASQRKAAVISFLKIAYTYQVIDSQQATALGLTPYKAKRSKSKRITGRRLSKSEVRNLREVIPMNTIVGYRNRAIIDLMLFMGLRSQEIVNITTGSFIQDLGRWLLIVDGKGHKQRKLKVSDIVFKDIVSWLQVSKLGVIGLDDIPIFIGFRRGGHLSGKIINTNVIRTLVAEYGYLAGLAPQSGKSVLAPHDLRRTAARNAFDNGAPLLLIQNMLGHASVETTSLYIGVGDDPEQSGIDFIHY